MEAYATLVMKGDEYVLGALALAHSIKKIDKVRKVICMCTDDVSILARHVMGYIFDEVVVVDYIIAQTIPKHRSAFWNKFYEPWMNFSFTKFQILGLTKYKKVLFVDADMIVISSLEDVWKLNTPAGTFSEPDFNEQKRKFLTEQVHGIEIKPDVAKKILETQTQNCIFGSMVMMEPNKKDLAGITKLLNSEPKPLMQINESSHEEMLFLKYFSLVKKVSWYNIHQRYNFIPWRVEWIGNHKDVHTMHYWKEKPWRLKPDSEDIQWNEQQMWLVYVQSNAFPKQIQQYFRDKIDKNALEYAMKNYKGCWYCTHVLKINGNHKFIDNNTNVICDKFK